SGAGLAASAPGDAGVRLYAFSNQSASLNEAVNTSKVTETASRRILVDKNRPESEKKQAREQLDRIGKVKEAYQQSVKSVVEQLGDKTFVQGFGSNGGEEFLSYLNISETLVAKGGAEWDKWDRSMAENLSRIQN